MRKPWRRKQEDAAPKDLLNYILQPSRVRVEPEKLSINGIFNRILMAVGYPREVEVGFLDKIIRSRDNFDISLHIRPNSIEGMMVRLNRILRQMNSDKYAAQQEGKLTPTLDLQMQDTNRLLHELQSGREKLYDIGLFVNVKAHSLPELDMSTKRVESDLNSVMIVPKTPVYRMREGFQSVLPIGRNMLGLERTVTTSALSACMPFTTSFLDVEGGGVLLGVNKDNNVPIIRDIYKLMNPNILSLSTSGGGKSFNTKVNLIEMSMRGVRVFVIDPEDEYVKLTKEIGGTVIEISNNSDTIINVMDLMGQRFDEKQMSLLTAFRIMFGGLSEPQSGVLEKAIRRAYEYKGILLDDPSTWGNEPPILGDVLRALHEMKDGLSRQRGSKVWGTYDTLIRRLDRYVNGVFSFMNKRTNVDLDNSFICFHIKNMPSLVKPVMMYLIMEHVSSQMKKDRSRKVLAIDEAWMLLKHASTESYIFDIVKRSRKYNLSFMIITQQVDDLLESPAGKAVLSNTSCKFLFKQNDTSIDMILSTFKLNHEEKKILQSAVPGEGILIMDNERYHIQVIASPRVHEMITTNADALRVRELEEAAEERAGGRDYKRGEPAIDISKGLYKKSKLSPAQIEKLKSAGYIETKQMGFKRKGAELYMLKPEASPSNMGEDHMFLVKLVEQEIRKYTDKVVLASTKEPDIVFENKDGMKVAVEIESGTTLLTRPDKLREKVKGLNEKFGKSWFFVVTRFDIKAKYEEFGKTLTRTMVPEMIRREFE